MAHNNKDIESEDDKNSKHDIAIIGMSLKMPLADSVDEFWNNIQDGVDCIRAFPQSRRKDIDTYLDFIGTDYDDIKYLDMAYLEEIDKFDNKLFRISPKEASLMDPYQRLFLETAWAALEDAGYGGMKLKKSRTGIYLGFGDDLKYKDIIVTYEGYKIKPIAMTGNMETIISSRLSYLLDLRGPNILIDTACSSSLVAIHTACNALRNGDCDMALAGGIKIFLVPLEHEVKVGIESTDARTRTYDDCSDGSGLGEGVAAILLKPLANALRDKDNIHAVIKGSAVNQDGSSFGITAPNVESQEDVIARAWENAKINPETIEYIETHGTGTKLGDPIEIASIKNAFERYTDKKQFCAVSSVKSNIGHLYQASGLPGIIKAIMALKNKEIPKGIYFEIPNKKIKFEETPVYINRCQRKWNKKKFPRRCGVSSFGLSGTNCHIVLEEAPELPVTIKKDCIPQILTLSAISERALKSLASDFLKVLNENPQMKINDICFTANTGRGHYNFRLAFTASDIQEMTGKLETFVYWCTDNMFNNNIYYGEYKLVSNSKKIKERGEITSDEKNEYTCKAEIAIANFLNRGKLDKDLLQDIGKYYINGADVQFEDLYKNGTERRISLPLYPFERVRFWTNFTENAVPPWKAVKEQKNNEADDMYFSLGWKETDAKLIKSNIYKKILILRNKTGKGSLLAKELRNQGKEVVEAELGDEFRKVDDNNFVIRGSQEDFSELISSLKSEGISLIIHSMTLEHEYKAVDLDKLEDSQHKGIYSLFNLIKAIIESKGSCEPDIVAISQYVNEITGEEERLIPENATLFGFARVIGKEYSHIKCKCIDIDEETNLKKIILELDCEDQTELVAFREGKRYIEELDRINISSISDEKAVIKDTGVYIITGGTGGIGLALGKYLAGINKVNLALISRSKMPAREEWDGIIKLGKDIKVIHRIKGIKDIEALGARVVLYSADVADYNAVDAVFKELRFQFGRINGVIHSAGVSRNGSIMNIKSTESKLFKDSFIPKVNGTWILSKLTGSDKLDFFVMCSSVMSIFALAGHGVYTAANSYQDSFSAFRNKIGGGRTLTINWPAWKETGMAIEMGANVDGFFKALPTKVAVDKFNTVIKKDINRITIGELNFNAELIEMNEKIPFKMSDILERKYADLKARVDREIQAKLSSLEPIVLKGRDTEDYTETEKTVGQAYKSIMGFEEVNVFAIFYEIGGDSIFAIKIVNNINKQLGIRAQVTDLLINPTIKDFAQCLDEKYLGINRRNSEVGSIEKVKEQEYYRVSSAQKRLYIVNTISNVGTAYNLPRIMKVEGNLDIERLENVFHKLINRHESLRTSFKMINGEPVQVVYNKLDFNVSLIEAEEENVKELADNFIRPFDLGEAPLFRVAVVKIDQSRNLIMFDMHHIISDGTSMAILVSEIIKLYKGQELPELRIQYKDFAAWQTGLIESELFKNQEDYWVTMFKDGVPDGNMPLDFERPLERTSEGNRLYFKFGRDITLRINRFALNTGTTLFMVILASYSVLLSKYTGQPDIVVGSPIAGRQDEDIKNIIGVFVNTLAIRNKPMASMTFMEFLAQVKENVLKAYDNQDYQFEELVEKLKLQTVQNRNPLFDTMLVMQNTYIPQIEIDNLIFSDCGFVSKFSMFDIMVSIENDMETSFFVEYSTKLFREDTIKNFAMRFINIVNDVTKNPKKILSEISYVKDREIQQTFSGFNDNLEKE